MPPPPDHRTSSSALRLAAAARSRRAPRSPGSPVSALTLSLPRPTTPWLSLLISACSRCRLQSLYEPGPGTEFVRRSRSSAANRLALPNAEPGLVEFRELTCLPSEPPK